MKLSEAIREGAKTFPPAKGWFFRPSWIDGSPGACALGCAYFAATGKSQIPFLFDTGETFKELFGVDLYGTFITRPKSDDKWLLINAVTWLNDDLEWSAEAIADYLESQGY